MAVRPPLVQDCIRTAVLLVDQNVTAYGQSGIGRPITVSMAVRGDMAPDHRFAHRNAHMRPMTDSLVAAVGRTRIGVPLSDPAHTTARVPHPSGPRTIPAPPRSNADQAPVAPVVCHSRLTPLSAINATHRQCTSEASQTVFVTGPHGRLRVNDNNVAQYHDY